MEGLAVAIQQRHIRYPDGAIVHELESFGYTYTHTGVQYAAPDGLHDDCVCALALAWRCYEQHRGDLLACPVSVGTRRSQWDIDGSGCDVGWKPLRSRWGWRRGQATSLCYQILARVGCQVLVPGRAAHPARTRPSLREPMRRSTFDTERAADVAGTNRSAVIAYRPAERRGR